MNRFPQAHRVPGLIAFVGVWLALAAVAQAQTHARTHHRHPGRAPVAAAGKHDAAAAPAPVAAALKHDRAAAPPSVAAAGKAGKAGKHDGAAAPAALGAAGLAAQSAQARQVLQRRAAAVHPAVVHAHMAGDPGVSIVDFSFSPGTTTIHVGDSITWTNTGKQPHTATANDHSFDTGLLHTGQSASHTFTAAGTFSYICIVHPFMHGTVVVLAAATKKSSNPTPSTSSHPTTTSSHPTTTSSTTATTPTTSTTSITSTTSADTLPLTGTDDLAAFALGLLLVGGGFALRSRARSED